MTELLKDLDKGLKSQPKKLSSKYFYDDEGSRIFQEIMDMPEYYLTRKEDEIFRTRSEDIFKAIGALTDLDVVELGAGDGSKTKLLLGAFMEAGCKPCYEPIDISQEALNILSKTMKEELPGLEVRPLVGDYFEVLNNLESEVKPRLYLFLGSNIGNYVPPSNQELVNFISATMRPGDFILIGADLKKNPNVIRPAYDDSQGITRRFNINLLKRLNREADTNFDLDKWDFYCHYNPLNGEVRSFLVSLEAQVVTSGKLDSSYELEKNEVIWTELSKKYSRSELEGLGYDSGLEFIEHFSDEQGYFSDSLFKKK